MVAYLQKSEGSEGFYQIIDFLNASHIQYALTENPTIYISKYYYRSLSEKTSKVGGQWVKKLEQTIKRSKDRRKAKIVVLEDEDASEDSSKQGRKISKIDKDHTISLIRTSNDIEVILEEEEPTKLVEDHGSGEKGEAKVSTAKVQISTAAENLVYIRRSAE
ncbi:hypothetical protein Tco_0538315 [Tanacetum coccineum]